ncbi:magnesium transporter [Mycoplasma sp. Pen4]|uniref:magnesium transporter n=1 Tax=Mycoplasma sp. Pen4 TaxID=640330 RepID=UPI001653F0E1|nr:magnesium transporter [Mycoplasma sp. Pen4]QNM93890.1 magnesium transporter [Mycoplasma sp. Pen4]
MEFTEKIKDDLISKLRDLIGQQKIIAVRELQEEYPVADFAEAIETLSTTEQIYVLRVLKTAEAAEVFSYFEDDVKTKLVESLSNDEDIMNILQNLQTDELVDVLEELPVNIMKRIISETPVEKRDKINSLLAYNDDQVGSIMSVDISTLHGKWTTKKAIAKIKRDYQKKIELAHNFYIVDENGILLGDITLEELIFANDEDAKLEEIYNVVASVYTVDDKEEAARVFADHDRSSLPVVSKEKRLIGMITADDVIDVIQEEATEDMYKMAGINPDAAEENYLKTTIMSIVKSRVLWLIILMLSATMSQFVIQKFTDISEDVIKGLGVTISTAIIVSLIPIISGSAGNAGSQSSTTITRAAALGEIERKDVKKVIFKEISVGTIIGVIMFIINIARLYIYFAIPSFKDGDTEWGPLSFVIIASSFSLFIVVIFSKFLGTIIPIVAIRMKKDPAVMSAPILTTLSDALSTLIFFALNIGVLTLASHFGWI